MPLLDRNSAEARKFSDLAKTFAQSWEYNLEIALLRLTEHIAKEMDEQHVSKAKLAARLGVSRAYITQVFKGKKNLQLDTLFRLTYALGLEPAITLRPKAGKPETRSNENPAAWETISEKSRRVKKTAS